MQDLLKCVVFSMSSYNQYDEHYVDLTHLCSETEFSKIINQLSHYRQIRLSFFEIKKKAEDIALLSCFFFLNDIYHLLHST